MVEGILIITCVVLVATSFGVVASYKRLRRAQKEYDKAREAVQDIVVSVNRQFKREAERLERVAYKVEAMSARNDEAIGKARDVERKLPDLELKLETLSNDRDKTGLRVDQAESKLRDAVASHEALITRVSVIEERAQKLPVIVEPNIEAVIPIRRDKALAPLTETELAALEMLATEGPKTAPEIKERIKLSREHTARLMKKLYEAGYLERDQSKIPFRYSVKKEMEKILKKSETGANAAPT